MNEDNKRSCSGMSDLQLAFKHGTYRVMRGKTELRRFDTLKDVRDFCSITRSHVQGLEDARIKQGL